MAQRLRRLFVLSVFVFVVALLAGCCTSGSGVDRSGPQRVEVGGSIQTRVGYYSGGAR